MFKIPESYQEMTRGELTEAVTLLKIKSNELEKRIEKLEEDKKEE